MRLLIYLLALAVTGFIDYRLLKSYNISFYAAVMLLLFPFLLSMVVIELYQVCSAKRETLNTKLLVVSLFVGLLIAEGLLRVFKVNETYLEQIGQSLYFSPYRGNEKNYWYLYQPKDTLSYSRKDFYYFRLINSLGFAEREINLANNDPPKKILCLGDSFTEGVGAPADSSWPRDLERCLNASGNDSFLVYNAGIAGSDPFFEYHLLKGPLWDVPWKGVIFCINGTDISDCKARGGMERFAPDDTIIYRKPPAWEPFYASSRLFRVMINDVLGYDQYFFSKEENRKYEAQAAGVITALMQRAWKELDERGIKMLVVFHPLNREGRNFSNENMDSLLHAISDLKPLNLLPYISDSLNKKNDEIFWPHDAHFNAEGYGIMAEKICRELKARSITE